jgi:hypothetical protein
MNGKRFAEKEAKKLVNVILFWKIALQKFLLFLHLKGKSLPKNLKYSFW